MLTDDVIVLAFGEESESRMHPDLDLHGILARAYRDDMEREAIRARLLKQAERGSQSASMALGMRLSMLLLLARAAFDVLRGRPIEVIS